MYIPHIENMGKIFNKEERATELIQEMQTKVNNVQAKLGDIDTKVKVLDFDSGRK